MPPPDWISRPLAAGEKEISRLMFGDAIEPSCVRILREKAVFFQPRNVTMTPDGNIWLHPAGSIANSPHAADFSKASLDIRAHFVHELTHVYQRQNGLNLILEKTLMFFRHGPLGGYAYEIIPGKPFSSYNIEQQACIVADHYIHLCKEDSETARSRHFPKPSRAGIL
ncbi:MAG: vgr related protein [Luteolibacter sp.]